MFDISLKSLDELVDCYNSTNLSIVFYDHQDYLDEKTKLKYEKILEEEGLGEIKKSEVFEPSFSDYAERVVVPDDSASFLRDGEPVDSEIIGLSDDRYEYEKLGEEND